MSQHNSNSVSFKSFGRYSVLGKLTKETKSLLFVFHGQGQLAEYFIKKFNNLQSLGITVIAPEGLHHYYLQGFNGRVGASWMTRENRLSSIQNYICFLNSVYSDVLSRTSISIKINLLGFSQGTATVSRWVEQTTFDFNQLILWGGTLPPDLNKELIYKRVNQKKLIQVIGREDPYIKASKKKELKNLVTTYNLNADYQLYEGGHDIEPNLLKSLLT